MDIRLNQKRKKGAAPGTRLYAPAKDANGAQYRAGDHKRAEETVVDDDGFRIRVREDEINPLSRAAMILCGFLFAGMVLFTLSGYERITRAYADINIINDEIEQTNLRITELDVQIECAVTIQQAQEAAKRFGMRYPAQSQYVKVGDPIPVSSYTEPTVPDAGADVGGDAAAPGDGDDAAAPAEGDTGEAAPGPVNDMGSGE